MILCSDPKPRFRRRYKIRVSETATGDRIWIPVEITLFSHSFHRAWKAVAAELAIAVPVLTLFLLGGIQYGAFFFLKGVIAPLRVRLE